MAYDPKKHLIRVQGNREYLPVAQRLVWFREAHPDWGIETKMELLDLDAGLAVFSAVITNEEGRMMAKATRMETARGFADYLEKAETGAVGRALAMCGFGTQFAPELEEGERIVDAPHPVGGPGRLPGRRLGLSTGMQVSGGRAAEATRAEGNGGATPSMVCSEENCGRAMTKGQFEFSVKAFGKALCPQCQKQHKSTAPAVAA